MIYREHDFTYGCELEWGDIPRSTKIPPELGSWDMTEIDVINLREPYTNTAADPRGVNPPVGGEINTTPSPTIEQQLKKIEGIKSLFSPEPTVCSKSHTHIHVFVPGLKEDIEGLKRLVSYLGKNQKDMVEACLPFEPDPEMRTLKGATSYFKYDGGKLMPAWLVNNIVEKSYDFETFIKMHRANKEGDLEGNMGRPWRYALNTYYLCKSPTLEFRCFRGSSSLEEISSCFHFAKEFLLSALNGENRSVKDILSEREWKFPPFRFSKEEFEGWLATKHEKVAKHRKFNDISAM